ncbi:MAG TPA: 2-amino-4-hydroxy-6-hydroxymethyldihydropteridine diphosphokinase [Longilinea sp.]|nr:2-amino-4-hydroxy-6-hydroxymethyldihydropteridine diphosphokinase [Longilinea sp.]
MTTSVYLGLGTNLGDRNANLKAAIQSITAGSQLLSCSPVYQTKPWGYSDQPDFYNQVIKVQTSLTPLDLLENVKSIELAIGRQPSFRYGPRLIDIDILLFGTVILDTPSLSIPHPRLIERAFMLIPLLELDPELVHPVTGVPFAQYLAKIDRTGTIRLPEEE